MCTHHLSMDPLMEHNAGTNDRCPMFEVHHLEHAYPSSRSFQNIACPLNVVELNHIVVSESFWRLIFFEQTGNQAKYTQQERQIIFHLKKFGQHYRMVLSPPMTVFDNLVSIGLIVLCKANERGIGLMK